MLHNISVDTNVNIELLNDLFRNDKLWALIKTWKTIDAIILLRSIAPRVGLREVKMIVEAFTATN